MTQPKIRVKTFVAAKTFLVAIVLLTATACAATDDGGSDKSADQPASQAELVASSKDEGTLLIYGNPPQSFWNSLKRDFVKEYPWIKIETIDIGGAELVQRYLTESQTGAPTADFVVDSSATTFINLQGRDEILDYESPHENEVPDIGVLLPGVYALEVGPTIITYNEKTLGKNPPTSMDDFVGLANDHPGKLTTYGIDSGFGYSATYPYVTNSSDGWNKLRQVLPATRAEDSGGAQVQKIATGEYVAGFLESALLPSLFKELGIDKQVGWTYASDGTSMLRRGMGVTKAGDSPSSAKLLMDYLLTQKGQENVCDNGMMAYRDDIAEHCGARSLTHLLSEVDEKTVWYVPFDESLVKNQKEITAKWNQLSSAK